ARVLGELVALVELQHHPRLEALVVEADVLDAPDQDAGATHRSPHLQAADVVEARFHAVGLLGALGAEVAHLEREHHERHEARRDEGAEPEIDRRSFHRWRQWSARSMNAVSTKSRARIMRAEVTTVRVVAPETPSAVGGAS